MRTIRLSLCFLFFVSTAFAQNPAGNSPIAHVTDLKGKWCRHGSELKRTDTLSLLDDVRYCDSPLIKEHYLQIEFHRTPPLRHTYTCLTQRVCSPPESLYLAGFFYFGDSATPNAPNLISRPRTVGYVIHDSVINKTGQLPNDLQSLLSRNQATMCRIDYPEFNIKSFFAQQPQIDQCVSQDLSHNLTQGALYGIYPAHFKDVNSGQVDSNQSPLGLILFAYPDSPSMKQWGQVPKTLRQNNDDVSVWDRRSIILNLLNNEMLYHVDSPTYPVPQATPPPSLPVGTNPVPPRATPTPNL